MPSIFYQNLKSPVEVEVEWARTSSVPPLTLTISALLLNNDNVINKLEDFVFYGNSKNGRDIISSDNSVTCDALNFEESFGTQSSYKMNLDLDRVSNAIDRINIVVSINVKENETQLPAFDSLTKAKFTIKDAAGLSFSTDLNKTGELSCRCITVGLVRRYADAWRFEEEMELKLGGLEIVYNEYMIGSIVNSNPFSSIGDLSIIEKKYKKTEECTSITQDGDISIIKKVKEYTTTTIKKISEFGKGAPKRKGVRFQNNKQQTDIISAEENNTPATPSKSKHRKGSHYRVNNTGKEQSLNCAASSQNTTAEDQVIPLNARKTRKGAKFQTNKTNKENYIEITPPMSDIQQNKRRGVKFKK